ncbi:hypothetical protein EES42_06665 [Streptomyces sp. ADI95-17]|nr:hypothetical protein EES42_06665 [Streptomyces sp. ADI95-17]
MKGNECGLIHCKYGITPVSDAGIVGGNDHSTSAPAHLMKDVDNHGGIGIVEGAGRLVCQHQVRLLNHETGQSHALLLSAAEVADLLSPPPCQTDAIKGFSDSRGGCASQ